MPLVSVVMPVRNGAEHLDAAITSMRQQTVTDWELIVIDDGSTDDTPRLLHDFQQQEPRLRLFQSDGHGVVHASNFGIAHAQGRYLARMDADDISHPQRLQRQLDYLTVNPRIDMLSTRAQALGANELFPGYAAYIDWTNELLEHEQIEREILIDSPFVHSTMFAKTELFRQHPYRLEQGPEDYELWLRMLRAGVRFGKCPDVLLSWRIHPQGKSRNSRFDSKIFARIKLQHLTAMHLSKAPRIVIQGAGHQGKMWLRLLLETELPVVALLDVSTRRIGRKIDGIPVHAINDLPKLRAEFVLAAVGQKGPNHKRQEVRGQLAEMGLQEGVNYLFVC